MEEDVAVLWLEKFEEECAASNAVRGPTLVKGRCLFRHVRMQPLRACSVLLGVVDVRPEGRLKAVDRVAEDRDHLGTARAVESAHHKGRRRLSPHAAATHRSVVRTHRGRPANRPHPLSVVVSGLVQLALLARAVLLAPGARVTTGESRVPAKELVAGGNLQRACRGCRAPLLHPFAAAGVIAPVVEARAVVRRVKQLDLVKEGERLFREHVPASDEMDGRQADQAVLGLDAWIDDAIRQLRRDGHRGLHRVHA
mmetsp:Transcript_17355/g.35291  ORF Transcript_17355/g.35291 Transcript_17355/m.35291 type:complete len:254 (-) Transcript_17355:237-998(-)